MGWQELLTSASLLVWRPRHVRTFQASGFRVYVRHALSVMILAMSIALLPMGRGAVKTVNEAITRLSLGEIRLPRSGVTFPAFGGGIGGSQVEGAVLVVAATDGPMAQTRGNLLVARQLGIGIRAAALLGTSLVEDEELLDLVEMEVRELLSSQGYDGDNLRVIHVPEPFLTAETLETFLAVPEEETSYPRDAPSVSPEFLDVDKLWRLFTEAVGGAARAQTLESFATAGRLSGSIKRNQFRDEACLVVKRALRYWPAAAVTIWIQSNDPHLGGTTPAESLAKDGPAPALSALEASAWGAFA